MIRLLPQYPDATALIVGKVTASQRRFRGELKRQIDAAGLTKRIIFTGEIPSDRLPQLVRSLSLLVAGARYEGYGMTPLEAMASGVPVIASDTGFFPAFIGANEAGILVDQLDTGQILSSARNIIDNPGELERMSSRARQRAIDLFGLESEIDGIHRVYEELWT